jgi:CubicO group peptidase (beta-lactamase class C family)
VLWRRLTLLLAFVLAYVVGTAAIFRPDRAALILAATVAHNVCAKTFVSGFDPAVAFVEITAQSAFLLWRQVMHYRLERATKSVAVLMFGRTLGRAVFQEGFGCFIVNEMQQHYVPKSDLQALRESQVPRLLPEIAGPALVDPEEPALKAALDHAFEEPTRVPSRRTKAVVVVHNGRIIAERYAAGVGIDTQLLGFSLTKSVMSALIGIMTGKGLLGPSIPAPVPEWYSSTDPRREIKIEHLLRMTTGLALDEAWLGFDQSSQMYMHDDMARFAAGAALVAPPGTRWHYSSGTTQLLARIIRDSLGGPEQALAFAWRELFNPLGMRHVTLEFDGSGTFQGASNMLASARDWARFGLLYLNDGKIGGKPLLPDDWVEFSAKPTLNSTYGAGFWTNRGGRSDASRRGPGTVPPDTFFAAGALDQRIIIIPSRNLIVVRLGDSASSGGVERLIREVLAATSRE